MRKVTKIPDMGYSSNKDFPMITQETWNEHAREALLKVYQPDEVEIIIDWFYNIRGSAERDLVGHERVDHHVNFAWGKDGKCFTSVYASMMSRMWIYAPYIIEEAIADGELK